MILDGWGIRPETAGNAVAQARTPNLTALQAAYPHTRLLCAGEAVGLPAGIMGNSEVGHLNIGAGRVVYQDLLRIDRAVANGDLARNPVVLDLCQRIRTGGGALHLMGLVSDGGVHSQLRHLLALLEIARAQGLPRVFVHAILDGRDTPPDSGLGYLEQVQAHIARHAHGALATICGRFYAMDRDSRWERTEIAYRLYTEGEGQRAVDPLAAVGRAYDAAETDEFVRPIVLTGPEGRPRGLVADNDGVLFFNFRADRARQITRAFTDRAFDGFQRRRLPALRGYACMTRYDEAFDLPVVFPPEKIRRVLGEVLSRAGLTQLRIAETEKYAHVTYFFNGGDETPFAGEDRFLVPSPKEVPTYDFKPEMSAPTVTREVLARIAGAAVAGCRVMVGLPRGLDNAVTAFLDSEDGRHFLAEIPVVRHSDQDLVETLPEFDRIRYAAPDRVPASVFEAAAKTGFYISRNPVLMEGRIEMLHYFQEQTVSSSYHRYGNLGERALEN
jgi:2,3-bisphosphoglycerate-independent phosphoglycerate mutase